MRLSILALLLYAGAPAFSQSATTPPVSPESLDLTPLAFTQPARVFSNLPPGWQAANVAPQTAVVLPKAGAPSRTDNAQIDPQMIIHPPQSSIGAQSSGKLVAQNHYPNLEFLPIHAPTVASKPLSTQWPLSKLQKIPTQWPKFEMLPAQSGTPALAQAPMK